MSVTERLRKLLEAQHTEPFVYVFKFVMPLESMEGFSKLLPGIEMTSRLSSNSRYVSLTFEIEFENAHGVIEIYERVKSVPGLLSL